uniref:Inhibitor I9 domain-containing protein n=1 Tax=Aegilops tauschii subsp. strangulata TaxID=200361 RepID=A0A452Z6Y2_AEGTS
VKNPSSTKQSSELARWTKDTSRRRQNRPRTRGEAEAGGHVAHTAARSLLSHLQIYTTAMKTESPRHLRNPLLVLLFLAAAAAAPVAQIAMAAEPEQAPAAQEAAVHIVYVDRPEDADPEEFHIRTLAPVLGSEEKARGAVLYHYKHAASGFSAKLTTEQVEDLKKQPGVLQVVPSQTVQLHGNEGGHAKTTR